MPRPKWPCQMRFTITRAVSGLALLATHSANSRRALLRRRQAILLAQERLVLVVELGEPAFPHRELFRLRLAAQRDEVLCVTVNLGAGERVLRAIEDAVQRVIVRLRDRVELVVV